MTKKRTRQHSIPVALRESLQQPEGADPPKKEGAAQQGKGKDSEGKEDFPQRGKLDPEELIALVREQLPAPEKIKVDPKNLGAAAEQIRSYERASDLCDRLNAAGVQNGALYRWYVGEALEQIRYAKGAAGESFPKWYEREGFSSSTVSRAGRLFNAVSVPSKLNGLSGRQAEERFCPPKKQKNPRSKGKPQPPPAPVVEVTGVSTNFPAGTTTPSSPPPGLSPPTPEDKPADGKGEDKPIKAGDVTSAILQAVDAQEADWLEVFNKDLKTEQRRKLVRLLGVLRDQDFATGKDAEDGEKQEEETTGYLLYFRVNLPRSEAEKVNHDSWGVLYRGKEVESDLCEWQEEGKEDDYQEGTSHNPRA
jgi:hypothetical protein